MEWMPVYTRDLSRGAVYGELDFFAQIEDADGEDDVSELSIHRDDLGWGWYLKPGDWTAYSYEGEHWIGSNGLTRGGSLPWGEYRVRITDRSGQSSETLFKLSDPGVEISTLQFPELRVVNERLWVSTGGREPVVLWFFNDKGILVSETYRGAGIFGIEELLTPEEIQIARWVMIYYQDEAGGYGLKSGPFLLDPESTGTDEVRINNEDTIKDSNPDS